MANNIYDGTFVLGSTSATTLSAGQGVKITTDVPGVIGISNDETVLFETSAYNGAGTLNLSEPYTNFKKLKVLATRGNADQTAPTGCSGPYWEFDCDGIITGTYRIYGSLTPAIFERNNWKYSVYSATNPQTFVWCEGGQKNILNTAAGTTANSFLTSVGVKKVIGVERISGGE